MDTVLKVPAEAMHGVQNFAIDFGGSVLKVAYIRKNDVHPEGYTLVHQISFGRHQLQEAISFIKKECEIPASQNGEPPRYTLTGLGTHESQKILKEQLNIRVTTAWEMSCFQDAMRLLVNNFSDEELFHPPVFDGDVLELTNQFKKISKDLGVVQEETPDEEEKSEESEAEAKWPCLMGILGSSFGFTKMEEDGKPMLGSGGDSGGRMFLGLGSLLTGAKTYEELIELAEKGDERNVHCYCNQMMKSNEQLEEDESESFYGNFGNVDVLCFAFGWCQGKTLSDFYPEDLAKALLVNVCRDIVHQSFMLTENLQVSKVILVGGFPQSLLTRQIIEEEFTKKVAVMATMTNKDPPTLRIMKAGSHLGALGAMLQSKPKPEVQHEAAAK